MQIKRILSLLISAIFALGMLAIVTGCKSNKESVEMLCDFESLSEIRTHNFANYFGRATLNNDDKYITCNSGSVKLEILGDPTQGITNYPSVFIYTKDKKDFSFVTGITADIFNASEFDIVMAMGFKAADGANGTGLDGEFSAFQEIVLAKNSLNKIDYLFDRAAIATNYNIKNITSIVFMFRNRESVDSPVPTLYLDNIQLKKTTETAVAYSKNREADEIYDFEERADLNVIKVFGEQYYYGLPIVSLNDNPKYISNGNQSLKVVNQPNIGAWGFNRYPTLSIGNGALKAVKDFSSKKELAFDLFWACDREETLSVYVLDSKDAAYAKYDIKGEKENKVEVKIPITDIKTGSYQGTPIVMTDIDEIRIMWSGFKTGENLVFYIDNIRVY